MRIAVTGGTGYVGAHTVRALLSAGHSVRLLVAPGCADEPVIGKLAELGELDTLDGDIRAADTVTALLDGAGLIGSRRTGAPIPVCTASTISSKVTSGPPQT